MEKEYNVISHPSHYCEGRKYEPKDVIRDWRLNFNLGSAVKYLSRAGWKDDIIEDLQKAQEFIQFEIDYLMQEKETEKVCTQKPCMEEAEKGCGESDAYLEYVKERESSNTGSDNDGCKNTGDNNEGDYNSGHENHGDHNSGHFNDGDRNSGDKNTGAYNSGDWNTGSYNSGSGNIGSCNSGSWNIGSHNSGDWNATDHSSGCFNTKEEKIRMFNKPSDWTHTDWRQSAAYDVLQGLKVHKERHYTDTAQDIIAQMWWDGLSEEEKADIKSMPNFDPEIFEECTGIDISELN